MFNWYQYNPTDGKLVARAIQVGLPPEQPPIDLAEAEEGVELGHIVPEADREVTQTPIAFARSLSIEGIPVGRAKQIVKCDVSGSTPIRLLVGTSALN